jgi:hypothetical protein
MGERPARRRRVLIEDARGNDRHLRATWHPETRQFVVSTWIGDTCTGAARLPAEEVADLTSLLLDGINEADARVDVRPETSAAAPPTRPGLNGLADRLRWLAVGTPLPPPTATTGTAATLAQGLPTPPVTRPRRRSA